MPTKEITQNCRECGSSFTQDVEWGELGPEQFIYKRCPQCDNAPQTVSDSLKARFSDWIDQRTGRGITKYGGPLQTFDGRDSGLDMIEELLDFCQYQEKARLEGIALLQDEREKRDGKRLATITDGFTLGQWFIGVGIGLFTGAGIGWFVALAYTIGRTGG